MPPEVVGFVYGEVTPITFGVLVENKKLAERGTYVKIHHEMYGYVLGQITEVSRFWDDKKGIEKIIAQVRVVGYRDKEGVIKIPKTPFKPEERVFKAHQTLIRRILGLETKPGVGLYIGLLEGEEGIKVFLDANKLIQKHLCVLAKTGAGKSYTVGVLLEELAEKGVPCVVIDPHGEYSTLRFPNDNARDLQKFKEYEVLPKGFTNIVEYTPNKNINQNADREFKLSGINLSPAELLDVMPLKLTGSQQGLLYQAVNELNQGGTYTIEYLIQHIQLSETNAKWGLLSGLQSLLETNIFAETGINLKELVKKNQITIINLKGIKPELQQLIVSKLGRDFFELRKKGQIPPFFFLLEEAHNFCPEKGVGSAISLPILRTVAAEGRKFGMGLGIVSQRPAKVDKNVLSQCNTQMILKVTNPNDIKAISKSIENFTPELEEIMKNLPMGVSVVSSEGLERPILTDIRVRRSKHGGESVELIRTKYGPKPTPTPVIKPKQVNGLMGKIRFGLGIRKEGPFKTELPPDSQTDSQRSSDIGTDNQNGALHESTKPITNEHEKRPAEPDVYQSPSKANEAQELNERPDAIEPVQPTHEYQSHNEPAIEIIIPHKKKDKEDEESYTEWVESLKPDELEYLEQERRNTLKRRVFKRIKNFFIEDEIGE